MPAELSVVIPAHDERDGIRDVVCELVAVLAERASFEVIVVDDASTDGTAEVLDALAADVPALRVIHLPANQGHGPALRAGWEAAVGEWIGHLDADGEIPASELARLWRRRGDADLVLGARARRTGGLVRNVVTRALRLVARAATGRWIADANVPCKLVNRAWLQRALAAAPRDAFAPSVLLVVVVARGGGRIVEEPVDVRSSERRRSWLVPRRLAIGCVRSFVETIAVAWRSR